MVFSVTFNNISVIPLSVLLMEENHLPATSHWQTLSHNVVSSTPRREQDSNFSGDSPWFQYNWENVSKMAWVIVMQIQVFRQFRPQGLWFQRHCGSKFSLRSDSFNGENVFKISWNTRNGIFFFFAWWSIVMWIEAKPIS